MPEKDWKLPQKVVDNVLWPAAAGNVAWSFLSLLVGSDGRGVEYLDVIRVKWLSFLYLAALAIYLFLACHRSIKKAENERRDPKRFGVILDYGLAATISLCAISIQSFDPANEKAPAIAPDQWFVILIFVVACIGHATCSWIEKDVNDNPTLLESEKNQAAFLASFYAVAIVLFTICALLTFRGGTVLVFVVIIAIWWGVRLREWQWAPNLGSVIRSAFKATEPLDSPSGAPQHLPPKHEIPASVAGGAQKEVEAGPGHVLPHAVQAFPQDVPKPPAAHEKDT